MACWLFCFVSLWILLENSMFQNQVAQVGESIYVLLCLIVCGAFKVESLCWVFSGLPQNAAVCWRSGEVLHTPRGNTDVPSLLLVTHLVPLTQSHVAQQGEPFLAHHLLRLCNSETLPSALELATNTKG